jgi:hypothetical protein
MMKCAHDRGTRIDPAVGRIQQSWGGANLAIGSINQAISFLGATGISARDSISPISNRRSSEPRNNTQNTQNTRPTEAFEAAFTTGFSQAALDRANGLEDPANDKIQDLSDDEQAEVQKLKQRDREVRRHEQAHQGAAGNLASGAPSFETTRGPDGKQYAVSGEVQIDTSSVSGDPEATIRKMRQVQRAARAPAHPSSTDLKVASSAAKQEASARAELRQEKSRAPDEAASRGAAGPSFPAAYRTSNSNRSGDLLNLLA